MNRVTRLRRLTSLLTIAALGCLAAPASAKDVKPRSGTFGDPAKKSGGTKLQAINGKIDEFWISAKFSKAGQTCLNEGALDPQVNTILFYPKKDVKVSKKGAFSVKGFAPGGSNYYKGATARIEGRFTSSKKATLTGSASWNGCSTGKVKLTVAFRGANAN